MAKPKKGKPTPKSKSGGRSKGIPRGFKKVVKKLTKKDIKRQAKAAEDMRNSLRGVAFLLDLDGNSHSSVNVHSNKDGTVDGELRLSDIKRGYKINDLLTDVSEYLHGTPQKPSEFRLPPDHWVSTGALTDWGGTKADWMKEYNRHRKRGLSDDEARYLANAATSPLPRYRGQARFALFPQRSIDVPTNIFRAQQSYLGEAFRDQYGRLRGRGDKSKPSEILIRVYWNPWNKRPGRK